MNKDYNIKPFADLQRAYLQGAYLQGAYLLGANLRGADLYGANLQAADLREANLREAYLQGANLQGANLYRADLREADLREADLREADLRGADLRGANLQGADLYGANLQRANLQGACLREANLLRARLPLYQIIPEKGGFIAFKKGEKEAIIELFIPSSAKRVCSLVGRKCRANYARVISINGDKTKGITVGGCREHSFIYEVGKTVIADYWNDDIRIECAHGIHFFITEQEARDW